MKKLRKSPASVGELISKADTWDRANSYFEVLKKILVLDTLPGAFKAPIDLFQANLSRKSYFSDSTLLPYCMKIEYNNLYTHFIFSTLHRLPHISEKHRERIEKYITGIVNHNDCQLYAIYANPDHAHFLVSRSSKLSEENLTTIVGESSQRFISQNKLCDNQFAWQESAAAFSVSRSDVDRVCKYILNQPEHHRKVSFAEEYKEGIKFYQKTLHPLRNANQNKVIR